MKQECSGVYEQSPGNDPPEVLRFTMHRAPLDATEAFVRWLNHGLSRRHTIRAIACDQCNSNPEGK